MKSRTQLTLTANVAAFLLCLALPASAQSPAPARPAPDRSPASDERTVESEHRVVVDMEHGTGPRVWHFDTFGGYLGVGLVELTPELRRHFGASETTGVMISSIEEDSPASRTGLEIADVIIGIDGEPAVSREAVGRVVSSASEGETVSVDLMRDGRRVSVEAVVEKRARPQLLLSHSGDRYAFHWRSDEGGPAVLAVPSPEGLPGAAPPRPIEPVHIEEIMGRLHERLDSPDFQAKMLEVRTQNEELEARVRELETRLRDLSRRLEELRD